MDRLERFYKIDQLLKERKVVSFAAFKEKLGMSRASVKRDLEYMRERFNAPIEYDRQLNGYRFEALVFPESAACADWEIGQSRISKLWMQRLADRREVFNWDRGPDVHAADTEVQAVIEFLVTGLADYVYAMLDPVN